MYNFLFGEENSFSVLFLNKKIQFFYDKKHCGEIAELDNFSYYCQNRFLVIEGKNLSFNLKFSKICQKNLEFKCAKKNIETYDDDFFFYFNFKNVNKVEIKTGRTAELSNSGRVALNLLLQTELKKPLSYKNYGKVLCGFEIRSNKDYEIMFSLKLLSEILNYCERNYKIVPVFLNEDAEKKRVKGIKYNYLILKNEEIIINDEDETKRYFEMPLKHSVFKIKKENKNKIIISNTEVSFSASSLFKIADYHIKNNILKIEAGEVVISPDVYKLPSELKFKAISAMQNDFFGIIRAVENKTLKMNNKVLSKCLDSIKQHIKNKTDRNYLARKVLLLCSHAETSRQKRGLMRLSGLIHKMPKSESMITKFLNNENIYKVNFNEQEYLEIINFKIKG